jgi:hypothetical protein
MNLIELNRSLVQLRLNGMAAVMETRLLQAQSENMAPIDLISILVSDELACRSKRLLERRHKQAQFRDPNKLLDNFDFQFNPKMNRSLVFDLATANWVGKREDALFLGPPGSGKSHCAQAIGHAVIQQGYRVLYHVFGHSLWPLLARPRMAGFNVITEGLPRKILSQGLGLSRSRLRRKPASFTTAGPIEILRSPSCYSSGLFDIMARFACCKFSARL